MLQRRCDVMFNVLLCCYVTINILYWCNFAAIFNFACVLFSHGRNEKKGSIFHREVMRKKEIYPIGVFTLLLRY